MADNWNKGGAGAAAPFGGVYFLAFIGAAVYYLGQSHGLWGVIVALFKALFWPAYLTYKVFFLLRM